MKRVSINRVKTTPYKRERINIDTAETDVRELLRDELSFISAICPTNPENLVFESAKDRVEKILTDEGFDLIIRRVDFVEWWVLETVCGKKDALIVAQSGNGKHPDEGKEKVIKTIDDVLDIVTTKDNATLMAWTNTFYGDV